MPSNQSTTLGAETPINVTRLAMWKKTGDSAYSTVLDFDQRFMSFQDSVEYVKAPLYGCGKLQRTVSKPTQGALNLNIHALNGTERRDVLGETYDNTTSTATLTGTETKPELIVALAEETPDGNWNLYKYYNVQFDEGQRGTAQIEGSNMSFATTTLNGIYRRNETVGKMRDIQFGVSPSTTAGITTINTWFTTAVAGSSSSSTT